MALYRLYRRRYKYWMNANKLTPASANKVAAVSSLNSQSIAFQIICREDGKDMKFFSKLQSGKRHRSDTGDTMHLLSDWGSGRPTWFCGVVSSTSYARLALAIHLFAKKIAPRFKNATGFIEYLHPSLVNMRLAARHGIRSLAAWCIFMVNVAIGLLLPLTEPILFLCLILDLIGCGLVVQETEKWGPSCAPPI